MIDETGCTECGARVGHRFVEIPDDGPPSRVMPPSRAYRPCSRGLPATATQGDYEAIVAELERVKAELARLANLYKRAAGPP